MGNPQENGPNRNIRADFSYISLADDGFEELPQSVTLEDLRGIPKYQDLPEETLIGILHFIRQFAVLIEEQLNNPSP